MIKIIAILIEVGFWIRAFLAPVLGFGVIAALVFMANPQLLIVSVFLFLFGIASGVVFAEWVRRRYSCSDYFSRLISPLEKKKEE